MRAWSYVGIHLVAVTYEPEHFSFNERILLSTVITTGPKDKRHANVSTGRRVCLGKGTRNVLWPVLYPRSRREPVSPLYAVASSPTDFICTIILPASRLSCRAIKTKNERQWFHL